jgi:hypothetical protein
MRRWFGLGLVALGIVLGPVSLVLVGRTALDRGGVAVLAIVAILGGLTLWITDRPGLRAEYSC